MEEEFGVHIIVCVTCVWSGPTDIPDGQATNNIHSPPSSRKRVYGRQACASHSWFPKCLPVSTETSCPLHVHTHMYRNGCSIRLMWLGSMTSPSKLGTQKTSPKPRLKVTQAKPLFQFKSKAEKSVCHSPLVIILLASRGCAKIKWDDNFKTITCEHQLSKMFALIIREPLGIIQFSGESTLENTWICSTITKWFLS